MLIIKTHGENLGTVREARLHALNSQPAIAVGDVILLSQTIATLGRGDQPIRYAAHFDGLREDTVGISERLWGKHWKYLLHLSAPWELASPFRMRDIQVTDVSYDQGGPYVHITDEDEEEVLRLGLLAPMPRDKALPELDARMETAGLGVFHRLWSNAVGREGYVKSEWQALDGALDTLRRKHKLASPEVSAEATLEVSWALGLHARPASTVSRLASQFTAAVEIRREGEDTPGNAKSIMWLMGLAAECGARLVVSARGADAPMAVGALRGLFARDFDMHEWSAADANGVAVNSVTGAKYHMR